MGRKRKIKIGKKKIKKKKDIKPTQVKTIKPNYYKTKNYKQNEVKIKKVLKQPTEKRIYNLKDFIVYPKHGVGKIIAIEKAKIGSIDINFYKIFIE